MIKLRGRAMQRLAALLLIGALVAGCSTIETGAFPQLDRLGALKRGVSTKADVLLVLGEPEGSGALVLPLTPAPGEVWYYEDIRYSGMLRIDVNQRILTVFFDGEIFDGFLWFSNQYRASVTSE